MNIPEKGSFSLIKKAILYVVFVIELFFLFGISSKFVEGEKYFSLSKSFAIPYVLILILLLLTISLISQTLEKKWEIYLSPAIMFLSSFIFLSKYKIAEALVGALFLSLYFIYQLKRTKLLTGGFLKINTKVSAKPVTKGFLLTISTIISFAIYLNSNNLDPVDVGKWAADIAEKPIEDAIKNESEKQIPEDITNLNLNSLKQSNPQIFSVLNSLGVNEIPLNTPASEDISNSITGTVKKSISDQINKIAEPYRKFFNPAMALLVFGLLQIYSTIIYFIYSIFSALFLFILIKTKTVSIQKIPSEQEVIKL